MAIQENHLFFSQDFVNYLKKAQNSKPQYLTWSTAQDKVIYIGLLQKELT